MKKPIIPRCKFLVLGQALVLAVAGLVATAARAQTFGCTPPMANPIVCENSKPGNPSSQWDINGSGDPSIQGFATDISVNQAETVHFKINTDASAYRIDIYRLGYYAGLGARKVASILPSSPLPQNQPSCLSDAGTGLIDCGNWGESASWVVPQNATSGIYFAVPVRLDTGGGSHIFFIVRADSSGSALLFKTSDTTWQAYNGYGGNSLYFGSPAGRAYKVSYNRPFDTRGGGAGPSSSWVFSAEYPMVRWLEANGCDVSYFTSVDADRYGSRLLGHKAFLSVGHDEYWSAAERSNVELARGAGVHLTFFSGNEIFWKTRWENSIDGSNAPYRTLVCYKETHANQPIDPADPTKWTGTWRDPRFSPPADGGRPENSLTGTLFSVNGTRNDAIKVPASYANLRLWRNTSIATLTAGSTYAFPAGTLGYEWDQDVDNGLRPPGLFQLSSTTLDVSGYYLLDYGSTFGGGTATHSLTMYRASSGALVFGAGTTQWSWGLDGTHDSGVFGPDVNMQQATINLFADMGVQPATLQGGLVPASASTDTMPPISQITSPTSGSNVQSGHPIVITGAATDAGGGVVASVEVSVDGGTTWHRAAGLSAWTYNWTPGSVGNVSLKSRAVDDSGNLEISSVGVTLAVIPNTSAPKISGVQANPVTNTWAVIAWSTDEPADSQVEFGTTTGYGASTTLDSTQVTNHSVTLAGLVPATVYHYRVRSTDSASNLAISGDFTFTTTSTNSTLTITFDSLPGWQSLNGQYPTGVIDWGSGVWWVAPPWGPFTGNSISYGSGFFSGSFTFLTRFRLLSIDAYNGDTGPTTLTITCPGQSSTQVTLVGGQLSTIATNWNDACSPVTIANTNGWNTNFANLVIDSPPSSPPVISSVQATGITCGSATITWNTDKLSSSQTDYGTTITYGNSTPLDSTFVTNHSVPLSRLTPSTLYHYRSRSMDGSGNLTVSGDSTFATTAASTTPPIINSVQSIAISNKSAYITWGTDVSSDSQVDYGTSTAYSNSTALDPTLIGNHSVLLNGLTPNTLYHYRVKSKNVCGNLGTSADLTFSTTVTPPASLWNATTIPTVISSSDTAAVELGLKFTSDVAGYVIGVRFYKGSTNTGIHLGNLWTGNGALLASATFINETASGWQQVNFATPVAITANTFYVVSYHTNVGGYSDGQGYFALAYDNPPLHALRDGVSGGNGVYAYGAGAFPTQSFNQSNYWVDVLFVPR